MQRHFLTTAISLLLCAGVALAHSGVQNPKVMARMVLMTDVADEMKALGAISKGTVPLEADRVAKAGQALANHARDMVNLFQAEETDPKSEALPAIWTDFEGFTAKANEMEAAAILMAKATDKASFDAAFAALGDSCKACHQSYRK